MKNYLSFGGGVNSVALHLLLIEQGVDFESVFVHHGTDWPETYQYLAGFQWWLGQNGYRPITIVRPEYNKKHGPFSNLYEYAMFKKIVPTTMFRWCTMDFKVVPVHNYIEKPCFMFLGIDWGEAKRAKISTTKGIENRYPLIEHEIDREECIEIIKRHDLPIPIKSGCFICPFQRISQWKDLRVKHPDLFCKAEKLEIANKEYRVRRGKAALSLSPSGKSLRTLINENQKNLFEQDNYPPCQCGL